jgi:hypothetical protein
MGVIYAVFPLNEELRQYLEKQQINVPIDAKDGKNPTLEEIRNILGMFNQYEIEWTEGNDSWQIIISEKHNIERHWTCLCILKLIDESNLYSIFFEKGWLDIIIKILQAFVPICGSFVIFPDSGDVPIVVSHTNI